MTDAVLEQIKNEYNFEDGRGYSRDAYLKEQNIRSFFILPESKKSTQSTDSKKIKKEVSQIRLVLYACSFTECPASLCLHVLAQLFLFCC